MYVTTFYSFKGGVGRTLALLNVAYELAQSGLSVLVVDFDLEAPAIHKRRWESPEPDSAPRAVGAGSDHPGIVEYVTAYLETMRSPNVDEYIVGATPKGCEGKIKLMPSGRIDESYGKRLSEIDWNELYVQHDGYLMFEDMRAQWETSGFDYVLLDSRTGLTDVGGICTRHLPDAVVTMFRPDDQSLRGMKGIVKSIREESKTPRRQQEIALHFVMASIPAADDEDGILAGHRKAFQRQLDIPRGRLLEVRQYQSMDLLTQPIYTHTRPRTSLALSYRELTKRIRAFNVEDRDGILVYLRDVGDDAPGRDDEGFLDRIRRKYEKDVDVLGELAETNYYRGSILDAADLFEQMVKLGPLSARHQLRLAESRHVTGDAKGAASALRKFFEHPKADSLVEDRMGHRLVCRALNMLEALREDRAAYVEESPVIGALPAPDRAMVASDLNLSVAERRVAVEIFENILSDHTAGGEWREESESELAFAWMAVGRFSEARTYYELYVANPGNLPSLPATFNLAMAIWGVVGDPDRAAFLRVLDALDAEEDKSRWLDGNENALQALAVAACFSGSRDDAVAYLDAAEEAVRDRRSAISCWSYTRVQDMEFHKHCKEIRRLLDGEEVKPVFLSERRDEVTSVATVFTRSSGGNAMDETLKREAWAHYDDLMETVKRMIAGNAAVKFEDIGSLPEDRYGRRRFVLSIESAEKPVCVEYFPHGDSSTPDLADQPFLLVSEWNCGAFYVETSPHYSQRYWNTDISVTGYVDFREVRGVLRENDESEPQWKLSNDELAERLLRTLFGRTAI